MNILHILDKVSIKGKKPVVAKPPGADREMQKFVYFVTDEPKVKYINTEYIINVEMDRSLIRISVAQFDDYKMYTFPVNEQYFPVFNDAKGNVIYCSGFSDITDTVTGSVEFVSKPIEHFGNVLTVRNIVGKYIKVVTEDKLHNCYINPKFVVAITRSVSNEVGDIPRNKVTFVDYWGMKYWFDANRVVMPF